MDHDDIQIRVISLVEFWKGPMARADYVTDCGETGRLAVQLGLVAHRDPAFADLTQAGKRIRTLTIKLRELQADGDFVIPAFSDEIMRLVTSFTNDGFLNERGDHAVSTITEAEEAGLLVKTWPPLRLALTPKGQAIRHAAHWAMPVAHLGPHIARALEVEPPRYVPTWQLYAPATLAGKAAAAAVFDDVDDDFDEDAQPTPLTMRPIPLRDVAPKVDQVAPPAGKRRGRKPGSKNKPKVVAPSPDVGWSKELTTERLAEVFPEAAPPTPAPEEPATPQPVTWFEEGRKIAPRQVPKTEADVEAAAERARALAAKIKRWTTTTRR